jgi:hypothetical protein
MRNSRINLTAELVKVQQRYGSVSAHTVLREAKKKSSPLHNYFEWDDSKAAQKWRMHEARMLIATAKVYVSEVSPETVRAFVSLKTDEGRRFVETAEALTDDQIAAELFETLLRRMNSLEEQLRLMNLYKGSYKNTLDNARKPLQKSLGSKKGQTTTTLTPRLA